MENTTTPVWKVFVDLPASRVAYSKQAGVISPSYVERDDWQGSVRVSSTWTTRARHSDVAYDAFGVPYWSTGTSDNQFSGLKTDVSSGTELVSESRRYHPSQGRWESPDDGIPDLNNPQSFNAYHYSLNMPTTVTDPDGQDDMDDESDSCVTCLVFPDWDYLDTQAWMQIESQTQSQLAALSQSSAPGGALYPQALAQQMVQNDINIVADQSGGLAAGTMSFLSDEFGGMGKEIANTIPNMANFVNRPLDAFLSNFTSFRFGEVPALQPSTKGQEAAMFGTSVGLLFIPGAGEEELVVGASGRFSSLSNLSRVGDEIAIHHMPQAALGFTSRGEGGALAMTHAEHAMTRTFFAKGSATAKAEAGMAFRTVLARDIQDVRGIVGSKYNQGMLKLLQYYRESFPGLMAK
jgi:RHS repeat-associated protein